MDQETNGIRLNQWKAIVLEANSSGIEKREWCRMHGIAERQFYYWQKKIRAQAAREMPVTVQEYKGEAPLGSLVEVAPAFVELRPPVKQKVQSLPDDSHTESGPGIVIELGQCRILIGEAVTEGALPTVMKGPLYA